MTPAQASFQKKTAKIAKAAKRRPAPAKAARAKPARKASK